jgi:hypothetical protein
MTDRVRQVVKSTGLQSVAGLEACEGLTLDRRILPIELVLARIICLPSSADKAKSGRKSCSRSVENLASCWNGYSRERSSSVWERTRGRPY